MATMTKTRSLPGVGDSRDGKRPGSLFCHRCAVAGKSPPSK